jgi:hypothetical protein
MNISVLQAPSTATLDHNLQQYFPALAQFESTPEMESSAVYQSIKPMVERVINAVVQENLAQPTNEKSDCVKAVAWNLERGNQIKGILDALGNHHDLANKDLYLLTELDDGMARSGNLNIPHEIAANLQLNYVFAPKYIALNKGSGVEAFVEGENTKALHGLGIFSRFGIKNPHSIPIPSGKDKMHGKEKRLGGTRALIAEIEHPAGRFRAAVVHLDAHSSRAHRVLQMKTLLDHLETMPALPTIIGGDWNTTTHNSQNAQRAILGYWRRVMMGAKNTALNHYPYPERFFERGLFAHLEKRGFEWQNFNEIGQGTLHYDVDSFEKNTNLGDWVPSWCFPWIRWAMGQVGGRISLKLDWFTGKSIRLAEHSKPRVVGNLTDESGSPLSDHDAIVLDFQLNS